MKMEHSMSPGENGTLEMAQQTIARQTAEIQQLQARLAEEHFAQELREALTVAATAGTIASPVTHSRLLEMIVETAAHVISARAAALFLIDNESGELIFEVALGQKAAEVRRFRVPLGHGIAGLVAVTGQPMAVSDARRDPRQATDIAQSIGYIPNNILCVPLFYNDEIIGVLELLDKERAPSFSTGDMETLGLFANQAAVAIEQSRTHQHLAALIVEVLRSLGTPTDPTLEKLQQQTRSFASAVEENATYRQAQELARLVQAIAWAGEHELKACQTILQAFADYVGSRPTLFHHLGARQ
jgi:GAF domain-containing protein